MLKRIAYILLLIGSVPYLKAQNLVLNGSFENITECIDQQGDIFKAEPWFQPLKESTSDLFNACYPWAANGSPSNNLRLV